MSKAIKTLRLFIDGKPTEEWDFEQLKKDIEELNSFANCADDVVDDDWKYLEQAQANLKSKGLLD